MDDLGEPHQDLRVELFVTGDLQAASRTVRLVREALDELPGRHGLTVVDEDAGRSGDGTAPARPALVRVEPGPVLAIELTPGQITPEELAEALRA